MLAAVPTARELHRATQARLNAYFRLDWSKRAPYAELHPRLLGALAPLAAGPWPSPATYDALAREVPQAPGVELPRFVAQTRAALQQAGGYEAHVAKLRAVPTRSHNWHDFFNMTVWAHFPRIRWALNGLHVDATSSKDPRNARSPAQNAATQLDESGLLVASSSPALLGELHARLFKRVLWERRSELLATTRFFVVGHGTLESLLAPHLGLSAKALLLPLSRPPGAYDPDALRHELDARVAAEIPSWRECSPLFNPVPVLGIPAYADNAAGEFYDDPRYFRFQRRPRPVDAGAATADQRTG
jgi:hypothetical protein